MENKKRIYPSSQLVVALDSKTLKVAMWILGWQNQGSVKYYPKQFAKACKMEEKEVELCIQTLVNCKLIDVSIVDQTWMLTPNAEQFQKYYEVPISKVIESGRTLEMAEEATWNSEETTTQSNDIDDMSEDEMKRMLLMIQARLKEKQEVKKVVVTNNVVDDLPW